MLTTLVIAERNSGVRLEARFAFAAEHPDHYAYERDDKDKKVDRPSHGRLPRYLRVALLQKSSPLSRKFGVADRPCLFQPTELFNFICDAETNYAPEFIARLPSLLRVTFRHASSLKDQIRKHDNVWKYYPSYHPHCLDPAGDVVASE